MRKYRIVKKNWDMGYDPQIKKLLGWCSLLRIHSAYCMTFEQAQKCIKDDMKHRDKSDEVVWSNE